MDLEILDEDEDDWFFDSITRYKNLRMFELEYPVHQVEPTSINSICVSCSNTHRHQLLELALPSKHVSQTNKSSDIGNSNNTDLKIKCGTFTENQCFQIKAFGGHNVAVSDMNSKNVTLYKLSSDDSDEIKRESLIENYYYESPMMAIDSCGKQIWLTKKRADVMSLVDINTKEPIQSIKIDETYTPFECDERIVPFYLQHDVVAFGCQLTGGIAVVDPRNSGIWSMQIPFTTGTNNELNYWCFTSLYESSEKFTHLSSPTSIAKVSKSGTLVVYDTRKTNEPAYINRNLGLKTLSSSSLQARFKPTNKDWISLSGFDGNVYVYQLIAGEDPKLKFTHDGHKHVEGYSNETVTTSQSWSKLDNFIISSADNGTIQMWEFENTESV